MNLPIAPSLNEADVIALGADQLSIDAVVKPLLAEAADSPVLKGAPDHVGGLTPADDLPWQGAPLATALQELLTTVTGHYRRNAHPGMFAYVASPGLPTDPLAHALTAALNQNATGAQSTAGATTAENTLVRWMCRLAGLPAGSGGLLLSGGSWANLTALAVATQHALGPAARLHGLCAGPRPVILAAHTAHFSVQRAAMVLGIGTAGIEHVSVDEHFRMDPHALELQLQRLQHATDCRPCCVVASAGTTAVGAIDPLAEIARICRRYGVWLHVDAAYGGAALLAPGLRARLQGIEHADSITVDLHKWCYLAFDGSLLLYRDPGIARDLFAINSDYVQQPDAATEPGEQQSFIDLSPEVSRRARALPACLAWRHYGLEVLGRNVEYNADCAYYLAQLADYYPDLEPVTTAPQLSICCLRYKPEGLEAPGAIDDLNERIVAGLNRTDEFILSATRVSDRPVIRVCICSHQTRARHIEQLVESVRRIGKALLDGD